MKYKSAILITVFLLGLIMTVLKAQDTMYEYQKTSGNPVTVIDGNVYNTVTIGTQLWMAENLRVTRYADETPISKVEESFQWRCLSYKDKAYCWRNNDSDANASIYGALYTWMAAMNGATSISANPSGVEGVCPTGWHLPSDSEWKQLEMYLVCLFNSITMCDKK